MVTWNRKANATSMYLKQCVLQRLSTNNREHNNVPTCPTHSAYRIMVAGPARSICNDLHMAHCPKNPRMPVLASMTYPSALGGLLRPVKNATVPTMKKPKQLNQCVVTIGCTF